MSDQKLDAWAVPENEKEEREKLVVTLMNLYVEAVHTIRKVSRPIGSIRMLVRANQLFHNCTLGAVYTIVEVAAQERARQRTKQTLRRYLLHSMKGMRTGDFFEKFLDENFPPNIRQGVKDLGSKSLESFLRVSRHDVHRKFETHAEGKKEFAELIRILDEFGLFLNMSKQDTFIYFGSDV